MPTFNTPRRGSLGFSPRKRSKKTYFSPRSFAETEEPKIGGFAAYKAGMTQVIAVDTYSNSPTKGKEISIPATILECPPLFVAAIRFYKDTEYGLKCVSEIWAENLPRDAEKRLKPPKAKKKDAPSEFSEIRAIVLTQPRKAKIKKKPEVLELMVTGKDPQANLAYIRELLGKEVPVSEIFKEGDLVDIIGLTKGHGNQGPVKRWGISVRRRKDTGKYRHTGTLGNVNPRRNQWRVPQGGQQGYQRRTEYNKMILRIGEESAAVTPAGGFDHYGILNSTYIVLSGSIPGTRKRMVTMKNAVRPRPNDSMPEIREIIR